MILSSTVHIVPSQEGKWQVVDQNRYVYTFDNQASAVARAKSLAEQNQPSQVVMFDEHGRASTLAHYQLPDYGRLPANGEGLATAAVKALVISGLVAAGASLLDALVDSVQRDLDRANKKSKTHRRRKTGASR